MNYKIKKEINEAYQVVGKGENKFALSCSDKISIYDKDFNLGNCLYNFFNAERLIFSSDDKYLVGFNGYNELLSYNLEKEKENIIKFDNSFIIKDITIDSNSKYIYILCKENDENVIYKLDINSLKIIERNDSYKDAIIIDYFKNKKAIYILNEDNILYVVNDNFKILEKHELNFDENIIDIFVKDNKYFVTTQSKVLILNCDFNLIDSFHIVDEYIDNNQLNENVPNLDTHQFVLKTEIINNKYLINFCDNVTSSNAKLSIINIENGERIDDKKLHTVVSFVLIFKNKMIVGTFEETYIFDLDF